MKYFIFINLELFIENLLILAAAFIMNFIADILIILIGETSFYSKNFIGFTGAYILLFLSFFIRLPWQIIFSYILRIKYFGHGHIFIHGTLKPIIYTYVPCYLFFCLYAIYQMSYKIILFVDFAFLTMFSLLCALLAPYLLYKMTGKTMEDYVTTDAKLFARTSK